MVKFESKQFRNRIAKNTGMAMIRAIKITIYILFMAVLAGHWYLCNSYNFTSNWSKSEFSEVLGDVVQDFSLYIDSFGFINVSDIASMDRSFMDGVGIDWTEPKEVARYSSRIDLVGDLPRAIYGSHQLRLGRGLLLTDLTGIFLPGILSIIPVEKAGEVGALVVGRGTFVGVSMVIFVYKGEIVQIATNNEEALNYFVEHWQK